jgi:hypothetical protein
MEVDVLAELLSCAGGRQQLGELGLTDLDRLADERAAVNLEEVERDEMRFGFDPPAAPQCPWMNSRACRATRPTEAVATRKSCHSACAGADRLHLRETLL